MKSKLATIQKIKKIVKHPNADRLNIISVLGWQCITAEKYSEGDLCIYIPVDTTVPKTEWSDFLFKGDEERARIKSIKLRGEISQGLILPPSVLRGEHFFNLHKDENGEWSYRVMNGYNALYEGQDVTDELGIMKYEKPIPASLAGEVVGDFPTHLCPKTDEERCQNFPELLKEMRGIPFYISTKMDGSSGTFIKENGKLRVCSRNLELKENEKNSFWLVARKYDLENKMLDGEVIQAEIVGPGIQKNTSGEPEIDMYVFNHGVIHGRSYSGYNGLVSFCNRTDTKMVPVVQVGNSFQYTYIDELLDLADYVKYSNGKQAEGIVIRPINECYSEVLKGRLSFKVISNSYAVKHGE
jgi:RNA ligase (TIGR02306 family)